MARGGRLLSRTTSRVLLLALALGACARSSPELPPNLSDRPPEQRLLPGDSASAEAKRTSLDPIPNAGRVALLMG